jgi:hypothetical protein
MCVALMSLMWQSNRKAASRRNETSLGERESAKMARIHEAKRKAKRSEH